MLPPAGRTRAEAWVAQARRAASLDLLARLQRVPEAGAISVLAGAPEDQRELQKGGARLLNVSAEEFHFGRVLAEILRQEGWPALAYFGGASAPLAGEAFLRQAFQRAGPGRAVVNNYHSSDWAIVGDAQALIHMAERLPSDNPIGWVLDHEAGLAVEALPSSAASRADIDTPADAALLSDHPNAGPEVRAFLETLPERLAQTLVRLRQVIETPARTLAVIGRVSSEAWQALEAHRRIWVRVFSEERGMLASGRSARGEVRSFIGSAVDRMGAAAFLSEMAGMADGLVWDTRVWMAQRGPWPPASDRFAADLGWTADVNDPSLRALTEAAVSAPLPVLTGGHGVVAGGLLAMLETLDAETT
jgi:hypothetical protein